jgi:WD40 repeat protein
MRILIGSIIIPLLFFYSCSKKIGSHSNANAVDTTTNNISTNQISDSTRKEWAKSNIIWIKKGMPTSRPSIIDIVTNYKNNLCGSLNEDGICQIWNMETGVDLYVLHLEHEIPVHCLRFSHDGKFLATNASSTIYDPGSSRGNYHTDEIKVSLWSSINGQWIKDFQFQQDDPPCNLEFSDDNKYLFFYNRCRIEIRNIDSGVVIKTGIWRPIDSGFFLPQKIISITPFYPHDGDFSVWDIYKDSLLYSKNAYQGFIRTFTCSNDENILATTGQEDQTLKIWKISTGELLRSFTLNVPQVHYGSISPDGQYFAAGSTNGDVNILELEKGEIVQSYKEYHAYVHSIAWSYDGKIVFVGYIDGTIIALKACLCTKDKIVP